MKKSILLAALLLTPWVASSAATINWGASNLISGASDVSVQGDYFGSWAPNNGDANLTPVNGVSFQGYPDLPGFTQNLVDGGQYYGAASTPDADYNNLLSFGRYGDQGVNYSFSWNGMIAGHTYQVQIWASDTRNIGQTRWENFSGDGGDVSPDVYLPADGSTGGHYIIGTFVADGTGTQTINIDPNGTDGGSAQVNLFQVRDLGVVPEPASAGLLTLGLAGAALRRRRSA
ncbi:MAG: hypothetical protein JWO82_4 [Akkermansiaceae bacterium]|nr:hypothetical protein [Akkermansiaceae bacterium]